MQRFESMVTSKGSNDDKFYLYSGHDTGMSSILNSLCIETKLNHAKQL